MAKTLALGAARQVPAATALPEGRNIMNARQKRRICVFTGSRADYGPLRPLIDRLHKDQEIDLRLLVTGSHLLPHQGLTVRAIEADGYTADEAVDIVLASDTPTGVAKSFGLACIGYADALERLSPDILVLPGDRYEALAAAVAALPRLVTMAHIGGGQLTHGSIDDQTRHAISKLCHLHFVVTPDDRRRLVQMGEDPATVFQVGVISPDPSLFDGLMDRESTESALGIELSAPTFLITYHPATADPIRSSTGLAGLLGALDRFPQATMIFTAPNVDVGSREVAQSLREYVASRGRRTAFVPSLGHYKYLSLLRHSDLVLGNSSSGVTEAPMVGTPTVNIGPRQAGRLKAPSVIDCGDTAPEVLDAINRALSRKHVRGEFSAMIAEVDRNLDRLVEVLKKTDIAGHAHKEFVELRPEGERDG